MKRLLLLLLPVLALVACSHRVKPVHSDPVTVKVIPVAAETTHVMASYVGKAEATGSTTLSAPYAGTLVEIPVKQGQSVKKGQVLSRVYSEQVKAAFDMARASLAQAEDGFVRIQKLRDGGAVADVKVVETGRYMPRKAFVWMFFSRWCSCWTAAVPMSVLRFRKRKSCN